MIPHAASESNQDSTRGKSASSLHHLFKLTRRVIIDSQFDADFAEMRTARLVTKGLDQVF